jgi:hypothetical protein
MVLSQIICSTSASGKAPADQALLLMLKPHGAGDQTSRQENVVARLA